MPCHGRERYEAFSLVKVHVINAPGDEMQLSSYLMHSLIALQLLRMRTADAIRGPNYVQN